MDAVEQESNTRFATNYVDSFFSKLPADARFNKIEYQKVVPITGLGKDVKKIDFLLEKRDAPMCYMVSDILIETCVTIVKKDGSSLPDITSIVAPVNNMLHSLFTSVSMQVGNQYITLTPEYYPYKTYLQNLLTFDDDVKGSALQSQGYQQDMKRFMGPEVDPVTGLPGNMGMVMRMQRFREDFGMKSAWKPEGATFIGKLGNQIKIIQNYVT